MALLAQIYIHLRPFDPGQRLRALADIFEEAGLKHARELYGPEAALDIIVDAGSLRGWLGVIGAIYVGIANYPNFRMGVKQLAHDASTFSSDVASEFVKDAHIPDASIYRIERRRAVPGKLDRLLERADDLERRMPPLIQAERSAEIQKIRSQADRLLKGMDTEEERAFVRDHLPAPVRPTEPADESEEYAVLPKGIPVAPEEDETPRRTAFRESPPSASRLPRFDSFRSSRCLRILGTSISPISTGSSSAGRADPARDR
jgi:hypothetical protein